MDLQHAMSTGNSIAVVQNGRQEAGAAAGVCRAEQHRVKPVKQQVTSLAVCYIVQPCGRRVLTTCNQETADDQPCLVYNQAARTKGEVWRVRSHGTS